MNSKDFYIMLTSAVSGNSEAIEKILELYAPLINSSSLLYGKPDEDLRQYIILHIIKIIPKFKIL